MTTLFVIVVSWLVLAVSMAGLWLLQRRTGDAGVVDVAWSAGVGFVAAALAIVAQGDPTRRIILGALALAWSTRLTVYILLRVLRMPEDGRYRTLRERWGVKAQSRLFWFYQIQAFWSVLFALPVACAANNSAPFPTMFDLVGLTVWTVAVVGEAIADRQLARFRGSPSNQGKVCRTGLWRYSRHPNYFFEWLHWWTYVLLAAPGVYVWPALLGPASMLFFVLKVTGVPPTEAQALLSRGDLYRDYQRSTSVFFPWSPSKERTT